MSYFVCTVWRQSGWEEATSRLQLPLWFHVSSTSMLKGALAMHGEMVQLPGFLSAEPSQQPGTSVACSPFPHPPTGLHVIQTSCLRDPLAYMSLQRPGLLGRSSHSRWQSLSRSRPA